MICIVYYCRRKVASQYLFFRRTISENAKMLGVLTSVTIRLRFMNKIINSERRIIDRLKLYYYLRVYDRGTKSLIGSVVDISSHGMKLLGEIYFPPESLNYFRILLPEGSLLGDSLEIDAYCRWCNEDKANAPEGNAHLSYESGFEFSAKAESGVYVVKALIADLQKNKLL
jgi:hypothetical protein